MQRCRYPKRTAALRERKLATKGFELGRGRQTCTHQLDFVKYPQAIVVEQRKVDRPLVATHAIAAH